MAGILSKLTIKPLLYACGVLLAGCVALGGALALKQNAHDAAMGEAAAKQREAESTAAAWKVRAEELGLANAAFQHANGTLQTLLAEAQGEVARLGEEGRAAVAAAERQRADADRTLSAWMARYADQVRVGDCASALNAVQAACPAFQGY